MFKLDPPLDDGLFIPEVGSWSTNKHYFLQRYIDIFTTGMKNAAWNGLHYIDLFASAGIERLKSDQSLQWGSALIASQAPNRFSRLHFCELNKKRFTALSKRIERITQPNTPQLLHGDANVEVSKVVEQLPSRSLSLAFLDPTGLHLHFNTLRVLSGSGRRVDFVIFFPDHLDALRNWQINLDKPDSNLDLVLGTSDWRELAKETPQEKWGEMLRKLYQRQIGTLGYKCFDIERISLPAGQPLYVLLFASKDEKGGEFWKKIASKEKGGQRAFEW